LFIILIPVFYSEHKPHAWIKANLSIVANGIAQFGLITWEVLQIWTKNGRFDGHDILWTVIGGLVFQLIWTMTPAVLK